MLPNATKHSKCVILDTFTSAYSRECSAEPGAFATK
jgi:hypothetical protein